MKQDFFKTIKIVFIALLLTLGVNYLYAWTGPSVAPPGGNVAAPINVGGDQIKEGALTLGGLLVSGGTVFQGSVQIATTSAAGKVLTADATGNASWQDPVGGGSISRILLDAPTLLSNPTIGAAFSSSASANAVPSSGTIQAGTTAGVPANAKSILLYGSFMNVYYCNTYIRFKQPGQTNWKRLVYSAQSVGGADNSTWIPLSSSGELQWEIRPCSTPDLLDLRLEIQGYEIY